MVRSLAKEGEMVFLVDKMVCEKVLMYRSYLGMYDLFRKNKLFFLIDE